MKPTLYYAGQYGDTVELYLTGDNVERFHISLLRDFVEKGAYNVDYTGTGNVADPNTQEYEHRIDVDKYIDDNWDYITKEYYKEHYEGKEEA